MRKQVLLLLGLVLIGTLGLAAGIEASKGKWDYRSLLQDQESPESTQVPVLTTSLLDSSARCSSSSGTRGALLGKQSHSKRKEGTIC